MSTNEANIKITVDDSDLVTTDRRLERVEEGLESVAREARQAGDSFRQVGNGAAGAVAGLMSMELAKRALAGAVRGASEAIKAFAATNEEAQASLNSMSSSLEELKIAFGEALIGGDNATEMAAGLSSVMESLTGFVEDNKEAIQDLAMSGLDNLISLFTSAATVALNFAEGILFVQIAIEDLNNSVNDSADRVDEFGDSIESDRDRLQRMSNTVVNLRETLQSLDFEEAAASVNTASNGWIAYANSVMEGAAAHEVVRSARRSGSQALDEEAQKLLTFAQVAAQTEFESIMALKDAVAAKSVVREEANALLLEEQAFIQQKQLESQAEFLRLTAEQGKTARMAMGEAKLEGEAKLNASMEEQRKKMTSIATSGASSLQSALLAVSTGSAKERKKALKKALGQELVQRGGALIAQGIGNAIALNPMGALQIAGGASMVAAGAKLGSSGGGGSGGAPTTRSTPPTATTNNQNVTFNQQTQFGFVGDRRAATREIEEINRRSMDRGL